MHNKLFPIKSSSNIDTNIYFSLIVLFTLGLCSLIFTPTVVAQDILLQTGFEDFTVGSPPTDWEIRGNQINVTDDTVKTGDKSLGILGGANDDRCGVAIETENPIISVEFWVFIKGSGRSFNLKVVSDDNVAVNDGGVYMNWNENAVRLYNGSAWVAIDNFPFGSWRYVRVVADVSKSEFDYYVGKDRDETLLAEPISGLAFRKPATNPAAQWVVFHVYSSVAQGFVDDLLIYEGADPPVSTPVESKDKLTTYWGQVKKQSSLR
ncbi:hypothetical protein C6497_03175 [Candidatus Poribacteria bacterium]|nr:MAG: hypothetical protein C6497_03175 [Candidatus Poribacteria bacterium]